MMNNALTQFGPDTETAFFPVPESMRRRKERRRRMQQDLIGAAFTGVPRGFYRAYGMRSPLDFAPSTPGNPEATAERMSELEERVEERVEEAVDAHGVELADDGVESPRVIRRDMTERRKRRQFERRKRTNAQILQDDAKAYLDRVSSQQGADDPSEGRKRNQTTPTKVVGGKAGKERFAKE